MGQSSKKLLKQVLTELAGQELSAVPSDEEIRKTHIFSERFLRNMQPVLAMGAQESSNAESSDTEPTKNSDTGKSKMSEFAGKVRGRQRKIRILAACIACVLVFGVVLAAWNGTFSLRMGSSAPSGSGSDMAGAEEETAEVTEDATAEASAEDVAEGYGDEESLTSSDSASSDAGTSDQKSWNMPDDEASQDEYARMVMLDGKLYVDTGEKSSITGRCGVMDFTFDSSVEAGEPTRDGQTNFGIGYSGQYGTRSNRIEICINDEWHVFAYQENDLEDVSLVVEEVTAEALTISVQNDSDSELTFGQQYELEMYDEELDAWMGVTDVTDIAYEDIAYVVEPGKTTTETVTVDWSEKYATMEAGIYRIVKTISVTDAPDGTGEHTLTAEFAIQ